MDILKLYEPPAKAQLDEFLNNLNFILPIGFIDFFSKSNGAEFRRKDSAFVILWPLTEMFKLNKDYNVHVYAPSFFIFGSDGGDTSYCINKHSGYIHEMPFVGMSDDDAIFIYKTFTELLEYW